MPHRCTTARNRFVLPHTSFNAAVGNTTLSEDFSNTLRTAGWSVDTDLSAHELEDGPPLEVRGASDAEREEAARAALQLLNDLPDKRALVLKNSHIGGHKYAGNVIVRVASLYFK